MDHTAYLFTNIALIISSIIFSLVFLFLPTPQTEGLKSYRVSLRFLALAYFSLAVLIAIELLYGSNSAKLPIELTTISLQTILFSFALITLFNNNFANKKYVLKHLIPSLLYIIFSIVSGFIWSSPGLENMSDYVANYTHPYAVLNMLFTLYCIVQIIYFWRLFTLEVRKYELKLDEYYADTYQLQLNWVRYCFYGALAFGILITVSMFLPSATFAMIVTITNILFYIAFGLSYIQYPLTYAIIEPVLSTPAPGNNDELDAIPRTLVWDNLKSLVITNKYYISPDVSIEDMAKYLKIGRTTLSNIINKEEGMNFHAWINNLRIEEAKHLFITNPYRTIGQVADMVGFSEPSNFSRQFKQITNQSPSVWRQQQMDGHLDINIKL